MHPITGLGMNIRFTVLRRRSLAAIAAVTGIAAALASQGASAQSIQRIDAAQSPTCAGCTLTLTKITTLGRIDEEEAPGTPQISSGLAYDSKGRWYATSVPGDKILVYEPSGKLLQTIGRKGGGPGEFDRAMKIAIGSADSIHVLDQTRITTFSPAFKYVRTTPAPGPIMGPFVPFSNGEFVVSTPPFRQNAQPLRTLSSSREARPFGPKLTQSLGSCSMCANVMLGTGRRRGEFWALRSTAYEVSQWRAGGELLRQVAVANSPWFTPTRPENVNTDRNATPRPNVFHVHEDAAGRLWVEGHIPSAAWKPFPPPAANMGRQQAGPIGGGQAPNEARRDMMITVIDILDPAANRVVLSQQFQGRNLRLVSPDFISEVREDADGAVVLDIFKVVLKRP